jgi:hypothetical protein
MTNSSTVRQPEVDESTEMLDADLSLKNLKTEMMSDQENAANDKDFEKEESRPEYNDGLVNRSLEYRGSKTDRKILQAEIEKNLESGDTTEVLRDDKKLSLVNDQIEKLKHGWDKVPGFLRSDMS